MRFVRIVKRSKRECLDIISDIVTFFFKSETSLVLLGVKSIRSLIRVAHLQFANKGSSHSYTLALFFKLVLIASKRKMEGKIAYNAN